MESTNNQLQALGLKDEVDLERESRKYKEGLWTYNKKFVNFLLFLKGDMRVIGACGFHTWYVDHRRAEIGYALYHKDDQAKGYMKEALAAVLKYGFDHMNLNRVEAFVGSDNLPSIKLMAHFGFQKEGLLRQHYYWQDKMEDSLAFGLIKQDYLK